MLKKPQDSPHEATHSSQERALRLLSSDYYWYELRRPRQFYFSPLLIRIFFINSLSVLIVLAGLFYVGRYQGQQIEQAKNNLRNEARLMAGLLSEGFLRSPPKELQKNLQQLIATSGGRARIFGANGNLTADTYWNDSQMIADQGRPAGYYDSLDSIIDWLTQLIQSSSARRGINRFDDTGVVVIDVYPDAVAAMKGQPSASLWKDQKDNLVVMAASPITQNEKTVGVLLLSRSGFTIDNAVRQQREDALWVVAAGLIATCLISIYLAFSIGRPIQKLAKAADDIQGLQGRKTPIPNFSRRRDEIGNLSIAFQRMMNDLWQRMEELDQFAADVTHELKNPLTSLRSAIETLRIVKNEDQKRRLYNVIQDDVQRLDRLVSDIAALSRLDAQLLRTPPEKINLKDIIVQIVQSYNIMMKSGDSAQNMSLVFNAPKKTVTVWGIPSRLQQILRNLIDNALSFAPPGSAIQLTIEQQGKEAVVTIEDEGPGIPDDKLDKIFTRFYTDRKIGDEAQKIKFGGHSGLGLSIVRQIVEANGGTIHAENRKDSQHGARFVFTLPIAE